MFIAQTRSKTLCSNLLVDVVSFLLLQGFVIFEKSSYHVLSFHSFFMTSRSFSLDFLHPWWRVAENDDRSEAAEVLFAGPLGEWHRPHRTRGTFKKFLLSVIQFKLIY